MNSALLSAFSIVPTTDNDTLCPCLVLHNGAVSPASPVPRRVRVPASSSWVAAAGLNTSRAALTRLQRPQMCHTQSRITPCRLHSREPAILRAETVKQWGQQQPAPCTTTWEPSCVAASCPRIASNHLWAVGGGGVRRVARQGDEPKASGGRPPSS